MTRSLSGPVVYPACLLLIFVCALTFAGVNQKQTFTGTLVDMTCASDPKRDLSKLRSEHSRKCLQMPVCAQSGYALLTDQAEVLPFDTQGNELARKLIQKNSRTKGWRVMVVGAVERDLLIVRQLRLMGDTVPAAVKKPVARETCHKPEHVRKQSLPQLS